MYDNHRFCYCAACNTAARLTLKVITHYGEFTGYTVKNFSKLIGKDVIVAHQLLKNDIDHHEYWLVTDKLLPEGKAPGFSEWMKWEQSRKETETGDITFQYTQIGSLKDQIEPEEPFQLELSDKVKVLSFTREYDTEIIAFFHAVGDFRYRNEWQQGVSEVQELSHFLPRVGMKYKVVTNKAVEMVYASSYTFGEERIEFSETDDKKSKALYYTLEKISDTRTRLTIDYYINRSVFGPAYFHLFEKNKVKQLYNRSLDKLDAVAKSVVLP